MSAGRKVNSQSQNWGTPSNYVRAIHQFFQDGVDLDPCSNEHSVVGAKVEYRLPRQDGLKEPWDHRSIYVNPPYGADRERGTRIIHWLARCQMAHQQFGSEVLALVPVASNTLHWKRHVWPHAACIAFLYDTRLKFSVDGRDGGKGAPMSCAMIYWGTRQGRFKEVCSVFGAVVDLGPPDARMVTATVIQATRRSRSQPASDRQGNMLGEFRRDFPASPLAEPRRQASKACP